MRCPICWRRFTGSRGCPEHGAVAVTREPPPPPPPPAELGGLTPGELLGHGGFSAVWAGRLEDRRVAIKIGHRGTGAARRRATREAAALERLAGVHAPTLYRFDVSTPRPYLVMDYVGKTLEHRLEAEDPTFAPLTAGTEIAKAIAAVHAAGVVHGDLKPDNLAFVSTAVLLDFGSASLDGAPAPLAASVEYMAPELWRAGTITAASDVYALGVLLYELITGRPPFVGDARTIAHQHLMLRPALAGIAPPVAALIGRCLAKEPARRPTAREIAEELHQLGPGRSQQSGTETRKGKVRSHRASVVTVAMRGRAAARAAPRNSTRRCVVMVAEVRAEAPAIAATIERHGGDLLLVRGERVVAAWSGARGDPARGGAAAARELHQRHGARAFLGVERIAWDERAGALRPARTNLEPAWVVPARWRGVIGTSDVAALLSIEEPGGLHDLTADEAPREADGAALLGRDAELAAARAVIGRRWACVIEGEPGLGKSRLARQLARELEVTCASARGLWADDIRALGGRGLVIDDAEATSDAVIDALIEVSVRPLVLAGPAGRLRRLLQIIPHDVVTLAPLDDEAAARLLEQRLGVERIPVHLLERLVALGEGRPRQLVELAAHLRSTGAVRRHPELDRTYLVPEAVTLPHEDAASWLAEAALAALPAELRSIAAACALLEPGFEVGELEAAANAAAADGAVADPASALVALSLRHIAVSEKGGWRLTSASLAAAALPGLADPSAAAAAVLAYGELTWAGQLDERRRRALARYATAAGDPARAAQLWLTLADDGRRAHRDVDAETYYTAALTGPLAQPDRCAALLGRGITRYRLDRAADALTDLDAAAQLAGALRDSVRQARAQLELATAYDWLGRYEDSARACESAVNPWASTPAGGPDGPIARALAMARGRTAVRAGRYADARRLLEAAIDIEGQAPDDDRLIAQVLLGPTLVQLGDLAAAERSFAAVLAEAERLGDGLARCAALGNRVLLWSARGDHARARADLEAARSLARRLGHSVPERNATLNLAEYLYWAGELDEAAHLADAARELQRRLVAEPLEDEVLIARIAAARGDLPAARAALERAASLHRDWSAGVRCLRDAVAAFVDGAPVLELDRLEAEAAAQLVGEERIEILAWRAATHARQGDQVAASATATRALALGSSLQGWRLDFSGPSTSD